jgi:hypothetical protein
MGRRAAAQSREPEEVNDEEGEGRQNKGQRKKAMSDAIKLIRELAEERNKKERDNREAEKRKNEKARLARVAAIDPIMSIFRDVQNEDKRRFSLLGVNYYTTSISETFDGPRLCNRDNGKWIGISCGADGFKLNWVSTRRESDIRVAAAKTIDELIPTAIDALADIVR